MKTRPVRRFPLLAVVPALLAPALAVAQALPCFESVPFTPWQPVGVAVGFGASRPLTGADEVELCSLSTGPAELSDSFQGLLRGVTGDYTLTATVTELDADGTAGLVLSADPQRVDAAHFYIAARRLQDSATLLVASAVRPALGAPSTSLDSVPVEASLPLTLRLIRKDGVLSTSIVDRDGEHLQLGIAAGGTDLASWGQLGLMQAGDSPLTESRARFAAPALELAFVPPAVVDCSDTTTLPQSGGTMTFTGFGFDRLTAAHIGGAPLTVVAATKSTLTVQVAPVPVPVFGSLSLEIDGRLQETGQTFARGGRTFLRADLNDDGLVNLDDLRALRRALRTNTLPDCRAAADVNADGRVDAVDDTALAAWVNGRRGAVPPAAPFPQAGTVAGLPACGLPEGPIVRRLLDANGVALAGPVAAGSILRVMGTNLPADPLIRFGSVAAKVRPGGTASRVDVELGAVPSAGRRCLVVQSGRGGQPNVGPQFGLAYGNDVVSRPDLCPDMLPSRLGFAAEARAEADGTLFLPIAPAQWSPAVTLRVNVDLAFPLVEGESRGPRHASFAFTHNASGGAGTAPVTYATWLDALAIETAEHLGTADDCDCEAEVLPDAQAGGLWIKPCFQTAPVPPPPPPPAGTVPGGLPLKALRPSLGAASAFAPPPTLSCASLNGGGTARQIAWCHLAQISATRNELVDPVNDHPSYLGLPMWEGFRPMNTLVAANPAPWTIDPREQNVWQKYIKVEFPLADHMQSRDYFSACAIAARAHYCETFQASWMPALPQGTRILKTFWRTLAELPLTADPNGFYSYAPPQDERRYLVGMHVSVATGTQNSLEGYVSWATFWAPIPAGDTLTKGGTPLDLEFNPSCFSGGPEGRPAELAGTPWGNFHMCVQTGSGDHCGNPWGPFNECAPNPAEDEGCTKCHEREGKINWTHGSHEQPYEPFSVMAWLAVPSDIADDARACMDVIVNEEAEGNHPYQGLVNCDGE